MAQVKKVLILCHFLLAKYYIMMYNIFMAKRKNAYPDWAEKFRATGKTIRKVKDGYALYECTSVYVKDGYPKLKQKYLGMITEKDGFVPKRIGSPAPLYLEYGLSRVIWLNFRREVSRHVFQCGDELMKLGVVAYVFGGLDDAYIRNSYLTYSDSERLSAVAAKIPAGRVERVCEAISAAFERKVADEHDRDIIRKLMMLCVVEAGPRSVRKPEIPGDAGAALEKYGMKY